MCAMFEVRCLCPTRHVLALGLSSLADARAARGRARGAAAGAGPLARLTGLSWLRTALAVMMRDSRSALFFHTDHTPERPDQ